MATTSATAMTGGTVYNLINQPHPSVSSSKIQLNLYVKEDSVNTSTRETTLKLGLYVKITNSSSKISIGPWSDYGPVTYEGQEYYSYLDDTANTYDGAIPKITTQEHWLVSNVEKVVKHNDDGTASTTIPWAWLVNSSWAGIVYPFGGDGTYSIPEVTITSMSPKSYPVVYYMNDENNTNLGAEHKYYNTTFYINSTIPTRSGFEFLEWNTKQDGTGTSYQPGAAYTNNSALFLYAKWRAKTAYTVTYNANGGSGAPAAQTKYKDETLTLSETKPTKTGYNFRGWGTSASTTTVTYRPGANYTANAAITLYAIWELKTYTITYDANGGEGGPTTQTKQHGVAITLSTEQPTLPGYKFWGWDLTKRSLTGAFSADWDYNPGDTFTSNSDTTLYAVWEKKNYTITYNANGGTGAPSEETKGHDIDVTLSTTTPTRTGYNFLSWNTRQQGNGTAYRSGASYTDNKSITLYAQWSLIQYTITFMSNGGVFNSSDTRLLEYKDYDVPFYFSDISYLPTRDGYNLKEWNTKSDGTGTSYSLDSVYTNNAVLRVYAIWERITYTVTYNTNGGTGTFNNQTKYHGINLTLYTTEPTRTDYEFTGWNTQQDGNGTSYSAGATYTGNASITLYAQWNLIVSQCGAPTYLTIRDNNDNTVTFSCKVGSNGIGNIATAVELLISFSGTVSSSVYDCIFTLTGNTSTTVSKTFSFKNTPLAAIKSYFGQECNGAIKCIARTVGSAGIDYASNFTNEASINFVWHEAAKPPKIIVPDAIKGDVCDPDASQYEIVLEAGDASINTTVTMYCIDIYDVTFGQYSTSMTAAAFDNKIYIYPQDSGIFTSGHTYRFFIKAAGQNGFDSRHIQSGSLFVKSKLPAVTPVVTCAGIIPSTQIYGATEVFLNPGFGPVMKISLPAFDYGDVKIDHYNLSLIDTLTGNTILDLERLYENEVYITADMLNPCGIHPTGINELEIRVKAVSVLCENDCSDTAVCTVKYINQCTGAYVDVHKDSGITVKKRAAAFVKVNGTWKLASKFFAREDQTTSFLQSDITYEALVDENDTVIVDINNEPIYLF